MDLTSMSECQVDGGNFNGKYQVVGGDSKGEVR